MAIDQKLEELQNEITEKGQTLTIKVSDARPPMLARLGKRFGDEFEVYTRTATVDGVTFVDPESFDGVYQHMVSVLSKGDAVFVRTREPLCCSYHGEELNQIIEYVAKANITGKKVVLASDTSIRDRVEKGIRGKNDRMDSTCAERIMYVAENLLARGASEVTTYNDQKN